MQMPGAFEVYPLSSITLSFPFLKRLDGSGANVVFSKKLKSEKNLRGNRRRDSTVAQIGEVHNSDLFPALRLVA
jgi:hypothetical protein